MRAAREDVDHLRAELSAARLAADKIAAAHAEQRQDDKARYEAKEREVGALSTELREALHALPLERQAVADATAQSRADRQIASAASGELARLRQENAEMHAHITAYYTRPRCAACAAGFGMPTRAYMLSARHNHALQQALYHDYSHPPSPPKRSPGPKAVALRGPPAPASPYQYHVISGRPPAPPSPPIIHSVSTATTPHYPSPPTAHVAPAAPDEDEGRDAAEVSGSSGRPWLSVLKMTSAS